MKVNNKTRQRLYHRILKLLAVDLSGQKELDADPKAILQIEFVGQLKIVDGVNADNNQSMFL